MQFDVNNEVVKLCALGMELEGKGELADAALLFSKAWSAAKTDMEKFIAAHYVARHQETVANKLHWDKTALLHALNTHDEPIRAVLPSLYLNIGKCYEDLGDRAEAKTNYEAAASFTSFLSDDPYGNMISKGIANGLERTQ